MIVPDVDLLVYAHDENATLHDGARRWWEGLLQGEEPVGVPWLVSTGFIRVMGNPKALATPWLPLRSVAQVRQWLTHAHVEPISPGPRRFEYLERNLDVVGTNFNLTPYAHIAALALEHGAEVHTNNARDFRRFPGLLWRNPLR